MSHYLPRALFVVILAASVAGCFNGVPFQVDLGGKMRVDYPEGDARRAGAVGTTPSPVTTESAHPITSEATPRSDSPVPAVNVTTTTTTTVAVGGASPDVSTKPTATLAPARTELDEYSDYDLTPRPGEASFYLPTSFDPTVRLLQGRKNFAFKEAPKTAYLRLGVGAVRRPPVGASYAAPTSLRFDGSDPVFLETGLTSPSRNGFSPFTEEGLWGKVKIAIKDFKGTVIETSAADLSSNSDASIATFDSLPLGVPLYATMELASGDKGFSFPFILRPNRKDVYGRYLPYQLDLITYIDDNANPY